MLSDLPSSAHFQHSSQSHSFKNKTGHIIFLFFSGHPVICEPAQSRNLASHCSLGRMHMLGPEPITTPPFSSLLLQSHWPPCPSISMLPVFLETCYFFICVTRPLTFFLSLRLGSGGALSLRFSITTLCRTAKPCSPRHSL